MSDMAMQPTSEDARRQLGELADALRSCFQAFLEPGAVKPGASMTADKAADATVAAMVALQERRMQQAVLDGRPADVREHRMLIESFTTLREMMAEKGGRHAEIFATTLSMLDAMSGCSQSPLPPTASIAARQLSRRPSQVAPTHRK